MAQACVWAGIQQRDGTEPQDVRSQWWESPDIACAIASAAPVSSIHSAEPAWPVVMFYEQMLDAPWKQSLMWPSL